MWHHQNLRFVVITVSWWLFTCWTDVYLTVYEHESGSEMADQEQKALELMSQAEKKLKSAGGLFGSLFG